MGIIPSEHTVEYADNITGSIAYYYDGDIFKIENRSIKFYAIFDDIYIKKTSIESPGVLFDFKLSNQKISSDIVNGGGGIYNENGWFAITPGLGSRIVLNKYFALGERTFICRFKGGANSQISIGSLNEFEGGMGSNYDDFLVNFATKKISYKILNGTYVEENALFLNPSNEYLSEVTRIYNKVKFTVTDLKTGEFSSIEKTFDGEGGHGAGSVNSTQTIISLLHDKHSIYLSSGDFMEVKQMTVLAGQKDVDLIAYGDSISEPEFYYPSADFSKSWTQLMKSEIESRGGKAIISGRSSTNIIQLLDRIKNELPFIRAKYVMITIGTNGGNSEENLSELVEYIFAQNSIPILNNIPCNESGTQVANNIIIENVRQKYGIKGTKFDIPTSLNYDGQVVDNSTMFLEDYSPSMQIYHHPNPKGAKLMYLRTKIDVPEIY
jgi:lysophospholipase L1-like esterase